MNADNLHDLQHEVEAFLYREAELLDERRYREWLDLLADDCFYWAPVRENLETNEVDKEIREEGETAYFYDTKQTLEIRIKRMEIGQPGMQAWAEYPPSRTRRLLTNVRLKQVNGPEIEAHCNFIVYRTRLEQDQDIYVGTRRDVLRRVDGQFKIARRTIILDQAVLLAKNISIFL
ncbi:MAG TPA: 3-phenylpropionate/cinnamic acid dioxygenase subunit beta [Dehalococcoidia bacterium]|nr:3-phenylpropionate/cinnamic acid dioxygenase subunit beta [Dehalococcoidia bacterium]